MLCVVPLMQRMQDKWRCQKHLWWLQLENHCIVMQFVLGYRCLDAESMVLKNLYFHLISSCIIPIVLAIFSFSVIDLFCIYKDVIVLFLWLGVLNQLIVQMVHLWHVPRFHLYVVFGCPFFLALALGRPLCNRQLLHLIHTSGGRSFTSNTIWKLYFYTNSTPDRNGLEGFLWMI